MYNVLIYSNNLNFVKKYNNLLTLNFNNIKMIEIASNKSELHSICKKHYIDIVILDSRDYIKNDIQFYLKSIKKKVLVGNNLEIKKNANIIYIPKTLKLPSIIKVLQNHFYVVDEKVVRECTRKLLNSLKFDFKLKGTNFLLESIVYSYINKADYVYENLEKNVYPHISKKYKVSTSVIKHSIIRSINNVNANILKANFRNLDKITSKTFITEIVNHI